MAVFGTPARCVLALSLLCIAGRVLGDRHLLSEEIKTFVDSHLDDKNADESQQSLGRMLLAFHALGQLDEKKGVLPSFKDKKKGGLLGGLKDKKDGGLFGGLKDKKDGGLLGGLKGKKKKKGLFDKDTAGDLLGAATGGGIQDTVEGTANALSDYLNTIIQREQDLLNQFSQGSVDDQFSYLVDLPETQIQQQVLPFFGVVNTGTLVNLTMALQEQFCSPVALLPRRATGRRTILNGPSFELTLTTGACEMKKQIGDDNIPLTIRADKRLNCTGHEVSYTKTPLAFHRRDILPEAFTSEECKIEREFGTPYEKVLYGGGPLIRFGSVDEFIDAVITRKYNFFGGMDEILAPGVLGADVFGDIVDGAAAGLDGLGGKLKKGKKFGKKGNKKFGKGKPLDFWNPLGPGRLLKHKMAFKKKKMSKLGLANLVDFDTTSPFLNLLD